MAAYPISVHPLQSPAGSDIDFGAKIEGVNLEHINGKHIPSPLSVLDS